MSGLLSYSGLTTKIRAMQSHLLNDQNFREIVELKFFDTKLMGDLMQRIEDHRRVEQFLTSSSIKAMRICLRATTKLTFTEVRSRKCCA